MIHLEVGLVRSFYSQVGLDLQRDIVIHPGGVVRKANLHTLNLMEDGCYEQIRSKGNAKNNGEKYRNNGERPIQPAPLQVSDKGIQKVSENQRDTDREKSRS